MTWNICFHFCFLHKARATLVKCSSYFEVYLAQAEPRQLRLKMTFASFFNITFIEAQIIPIAVLGLSATY